MAVFIVTYDLRKPGKDYSSLIKALEALPNCHAQGSVWFVQYTGLVTALVESLKTHIDGNDQIFAGEMNGNWASLNQPNCSKWLNARGL